MSSSQVIKRASASGPTKRASTAASAPKPPLSSSSRAIIAGHASLSGMNRISLGPYTVLHPYSRISSNVAPVTLNEGCVIWEKATIGISDNSIRYSEDKSEKETQRGTTLNRHVVVESLAVVEAKEIGEGTIIESGAKVGIGCVLGKYCTVSPGTIVPPFTVLPDFTVVFGFAQTRTNTTLQDREDIMKLKVQAHEKLLESLAILIPNNLAKWQ
ncbi:hypothetical protein EJ05DRAFT_479927 [Pseudovirgaria hyperparasitica]|uniref:Dynactin subunit 6 n=1 Tax=Pseudovirgaria hyperparasitica TaxID=470096 RepID=A0A6A6VVT6_9PEZI|nr:uncharacterized protein EJ05DRAFT_479927 [Pseudovirgaria hyperparasitica]KAF2753906.1 hypothetical protein EJ05DRAFT_479927 [Pseudovirgaria hyperparasitica]